MNSRSDKFFAGTSGLVLPVSQKQYPSAFQGKSRLEYYAHLFNSVEINSIFYKLPKESTVQNWIASVPADFRFTFKVPKVISHSKDFAYEEKDVEAFMQIISCASKHKGCLLIQFPPSLKADKISQANKLLNTIAKYNSAKWKTAIEFRNVSWYNNETYAMLKEHKTAMVIHDLPASGTPLNIFTAPFSYLRFHGPGGRYRGSYTNEFLQTYAAIARERIASGEDVFCYFNNTMGDAIGNLQTMITLVGSAGW